MSNEIQKSQQEERRLSPVEKLLTDRTDKLGTMLQATGISVDRFIGAASVAALKSPDLQKADPASLFSAIMLCAQDGLLPNGIEAGLLTHTNRKTGKIEVTYVPMIDGIFKLVRQSGEVKLIGASVVHDNDDFDYHIGMEGEYFHHRPVLKGDRGPMIGVIGYAMLNNGAMVVEYMRTAEVEKIRKSSRAGDNQYGPWVQWYEQMAKKSAIHRLAKRLPLSPNAQNAIARDYALYDFNGEIIDAGEAPKKRALPKAASQLEALSVPATAAPAPTPEPVEIIDVETGEIIEATEEEVPGDMF